MNERIEKLKVLAEKGELGSMILACDNLTADRYSLLERDCPTQNLNTRILIIN